MHNKTKRIAVIDIFAGPGGLGEGFSSCLDSSPFQIHVSIEFEENAHKTLMLRSFYRKLSDQEKKEYYYPYIKSASQREKELNHKKMVEACCIKWREAELETMERPHALGNPERWKKIKLGQGLTQDDYQETEDELAIMNRLDEIKNNHEGPLVLIGGPPCQSYSVNGRNRLKADKSYIPENDERFFLYQEYLKVLRKADPDIFVMENVEGILSAKLINGERIFDRIKQELVLSGDGRARDEQYDIYSFVKAPSVAASIKHGPVYDDDHDYVITASDYGVPQVRKRVILLGIKHKYGVVEDFLEKKSLTPNTKELLQCLPALRSGISAKEDGPDTTGNWVDNWNQNKSELIKILSSEQEIESVFERQIRSYLGKIIKKAIKNSHINSKVHKNKRLAIAPSIYTVLSPYKTKISRSYTAVVRELKALQPQIDFLSYNARGNRFFLSSNKETFSSSFAKKYPELHKWIWKDLGGVPNHETRGHMSQDLMRYLFSSAWAKVHKMEKSPSPKSKDFPVAITPKHKNWESGHHADRFRTIGEMMIPLTITSHLKKDGHAQIHYDPKQNRSITVREAARIQTFPDDYYFEGNRGDQYQQVGNAVPSFLAKQIAELIYKIMKKKGLTS